jgi:hypothetical protein
MSPEPVELRGKLLTRNARIAGGQLATLNSTMGEIHEIRFLENHSAAGKCRQSMVVLY